jgi:uncharacterized repeat protein (TIGR03803 family)
MKNMIKNMREALRRKALARTVLAATAAALATLFAAPASAVEVPVHAFDGSVEGGDTWTNLILVGGTFYGTTSQGGVNGLGTVFSITPAGVLTVLHSFTGGADGAYPRSGLTLIGKVLYGTTVGGGSGTGCASNLYGNCGTVYQLSLSTGVESVLYAFQGGADGANPFGNLLDVGGVLYGTTLEGGDATCSTTYPSCGTVFSVTTGGVKTGVYNFKGVAVGDGANSITGLTAVGNNLFGVTGYGGASVGNANCALINIGCGTVFRLHPGGGGWTELVIKKFSNDGNIPYGQLTKFGGALYGTTFYGGPNFFGSVFSISPSSPYTFTNLHNFAGGADGSHPYAALTNLLGVLYGTTSDGGTPGCSYYGGFDGCGTIFSVVTGGVTTNYSFAGGAPDGGSPNPQGGMVKKGKWLWGTTLGGGNLGHGTVFKFTP